MIEKSQAGSLSSGSGNSRFVYSAVVRSFVGMENFPKCGKPQEETCYSQSQFAFAFSY